MDLQLAKRSKAAKLNFRSEADRFDEPMASAKLPAKFYRQETTTVARELLGQRLVHMLGGKRVAGIIVETEAYLGGIDPAAHTFEFRRTERNESMYLAGGHVYVYLIYGLHYCMNVVTREVDIPEAVLIRALEPTEGLELIARRRKIEGRVAMKPHDFANGPGKLCAALGVDRSCDGLALNGSRLFIERARRGVLSRGDFIASPRVGVDYAGEAALWPLRFSLRNNTFVSRPRPIASAKM